MKHIYPQVLYTRTTIETTIRKQHTDGKYYLNTIKEHVSHNASDEDYKMAIERFNFAVYWFLVCGIIVPEIIDELGQPFMILDMNEESEPERLKSFLNQYC